MGILTIGFICALILVCLPTPIFTRAQDGTSQLEEDLNNPVRFVVNRLRRDTEGSTGLVARGRRGIPPAEIARQQNLLLKQVNGKPQHIQKKGPTNVPPKVRLPNFDGENSGLSEARVNMGSSKPSWATNTPVNSNMGGGGQSGMCTGQCKPPPAPSCSEPNMYDRDVIRSTAPTAGCCKTFKCYNPDGSFFTFHGLLGVLGGINTNERPQVSPISGSNNYGAPVNPYTGSGGSSYTGGQGNYNSGTGAYGNAPQVPYNSNQGGSSYTGGQGRPSYSGGQGNYNSGTGGAYSNPGGQGGVGNYNNAQGGYSGTGQGNFGNSGRGGGHEAPSSPSNFGGIHASFGFEDFTLGNTDYVLDTAKNPTDGRRYKGVDVDRVVNIAGSGKAHVEALAHDQTNSDQDQAPDDDIADMEYELEKVQKQNQRMMDQFSKDADAKQMGRSFGRSFTHAGRYAHRHKYSDTDESGEYDY